MEIDRLRFKVAGVNEEVSVDDAVIDDVSVRNIKCFAEDVRRVTPQIQEVKLYISSMKAMEYLKLSLHEIYEITFLLFDYGEIYEVTLGNVKIKKPINCYKNSCGDIEIKPLTGIMRPYGNYSLKKLEDDE